MLTAAAAESYRLKMKRANKRKFRVCYFRDRYRRLFNVDETRSKCDLRLMSIGYEAASTRSSLLRTRDKWQTSLQVGHRSQRDSEKRILELLYQDGSRLIDAMFEFFSIPPTSMRDYWYAALTCVSFLPISLIVSVIRCREQLTCSFITMTS